MVFWPVVCYFGCIIFMSCDESQVTAHLIDLAGYHFTPIRDRALLVLTALIHAALRFPRTPPIQVRQQLNVHGNVVNHILRT